MHRPCTDVLTLAVEFSYWQQSIFRTLGALVFVILGAGTFVIVFLFKMMSFMQSRLGPMEAGPHGSLQLLAEVGKWLQKEDLVPERADARQIVRASCGERVCQSV